jgi:hypothetical protein
LTSELKRLIEEQKGRGPLSEEEIAEQVRSWVRGEMKLVDWSEGKRC